MLDYISLLIVSVLFGGMVLYSFGFAPVVFKHLDGPTAASFLRATFPWYYVFVAAAAALAGLLFLMIDITDAAVLFAVSAVAVYARQILMPQINTARDAQLAGETGAKARFGRLHGLSVALNMLQLGAAAYVLTAFA